MKQKIRKTMKIDAIFAEGLHRSNSVIVFPFRYIGRKSIADCSVRANTNYCACLIDTKRCMKVGQSQTKEKSSTKNLKER